MAFELDVDALAKSARPARDYVDVPTFPAVSMDVAFVVDEGVAPEKPVPCTTSAGGTLLEDVRLFDVYRDEARVGAGKKSMAYAPTYRAADRTLTSEEVAKDKLLADRENEDMPELMQKVGIKVEQDETFFVEPKKEE